jgi:amino acid transporter
MQDFSGSKKGFGTAPVFFTAISTILGAILFLRFGYAVGTLGFTGVILIILMGHLVTIPTALAISEISTNQRVEGGGEYFIISRSFGLNIGATIGIALYFSQAISVAFYVIAFTEVFEPFFRFAQEKWDMNLPRQIISIPAMGLLSLLILKKGASMGVKTLYIVVGILLISLLAFFIGKTNYNPPSGEINFMQFNDEKMSDFFIVFAIIFPAFTGMTAGVGLSGDLKNPSKSIPLGTTVATILGMVIYGFIAYKLRVSFSLEDLANPDKQIIMSDVAIGGKYLIPLGLAASTISSAIGSIMVAPRTLQALGTDKSFPNNKFNRGIAKGKKKSNEPVTATIITIIIAFVFVSIGGVDFVAEIISMFFMITYGSICLISFLSHFGADPSYRPTFRSHWFISLVGFIMCAFLIMRINFIYAIVALVLMALIYIIISFYHKDRQGLEAIFQGAFFQVSRSIQVYLQQARKTQKKSKWRPAAICISQDSFNDKNALLLLSWISHKYGFGTYIHYIEGYFSTETNKQSKEVLQKLLNTTRELKSHVYIDTIISPSYTSAVAQLIQMPGISGMENNMIVFEYSKENPKNLTNIIEVYPLVRAANYDVCIFRSTEHEPKYQKDIHIWIRSIDEQNANLMILLSYIIMSHPDWKKSRIKIFEICSQEELDETRKNLTSLIETGRLEISSKNVQIIKLDKNLNTKKIMAEKSKDAALTLIGFREELLKHERTDLFEGYNELNNLLFVSADSAKSIT